MPDDLQAIVQRMVTAGEPEDNIRLVIEHYKAPAAPAAKAETPAPSMADSLLADNPALPWTARAGQTAVRLAKKHPVAVGATVGSALASGGASIPAQLALAALGGAGGAGYGLLAKGAQSGDYGTPAENAKTMAKEGALSAAGEGIGQGVARVGAMGAERVYRGVLRASNALQRDFGNIAATGIKEGIPVSTKGAKTADAGIAELSQQVKDVLAAKDAARPAVRGYLPPAQGVNLGTPPIHPTIPELRDPRSAGLLMRDAPAEAASAGTAAHGSMIAPAEIAQRGLTRAHSELADRALAGDATDALSAMRQRFLEQRGAPLSLQEAQRMKQAEQALADAAYKAEALGHPVNGVDAQFHKGIARGTREAIEQRAPEVSGMNTRTQDLIGLRNAIENANMRNVGIGIKGLVADLTPGLMSGSAIAASRAAPSAPALLRALLAAMGAQD